MSSHIISVVKEYLLPIVEEASLELYDVEFVKEGKNWYLRIYVDKESGVNIDDCEFVSRKIEKILDETDPINKPYILEVSSVGIERTFKKESDYSKYTGSNVEIKLFEPLNNKRKYLGKLLGLSEGIVSIEDENGENISFQKQNIARCKLKLF